ncbi:MAG: diguanylate cyclase [Phycisphaerales bacterium]|nr:diguanylate cyclase [Phycisphaerales bacterium]
MALPNVSNAELREALTELEQAIYHHDQWAEGLYGTLICGLPADQRDLNGDSHCQCRFGQWYYKSGSTLLESHSGFIEIGAEHRRMHQYATRMLRSSMEGRSIVIADYEQFLTALKRLRLEIATVEHEIKDVLQNVDPLTGTPSRVAMLTKLRELHELAQRRVHDAVVVMMDLDRFKDVNDTHGHLVGDKVLVSVAHYVMAHLRPYDRIYRYGGEEFLLCIPDTDLRLGLEAVERLREGLATLPHQTAGGQSFHVTVSFGLTLLDPDLPVEQSIDRADKALYTAKTAGRNRTITWDASMDGPRTRPGGAR